MGEYIAVNVLSLPNPNSPDDPSKSILHRAGSVVELDDETAERCLTAGVVRKMDDEPEPETELSDNPEFTPLERPGRGESQAKWLEYANHEYGLNLPSDTKRDDIIAKVEEAEKKVGS